MLAYENGLRRSTRPRRLRAGDVGLDRRGERRTTEPEASLAALAGMPISSRFCSWKGRSGAAMFFPSIRRRNVRPFAARFCSPLCARRKGGGGSFPYSRPAPFRSRRSPAAQDELEAFGPGVELHLHLWPPRPRSGRRRSPISWSTETLTRRGRFARSQSGAQPFEIGVAYPDRLKMIVGLENIFGVVAGLALAGEHNASIASRSSRPAYWPCSRSAT